MGLFVAFFLVANVNLLSSLVGVRGMLSKVLLFVSIVKNSYKKSKDSQYHVNKSELKSNYSFLSSNLYLCPKISFSSKFESLKKVCLQKKANFSVTVTGTVTIRTICHAKNFFTSN